MRHLVTFYKYCLKRKWSFFGSILFLTIAVTITTLIRFSISILAESIENNEFNVFQNVIILIVIGYLLNTFFNIISALLLDRYLINASKLIRQEVMKRLHNLDFKYHVNKNSGSLISAFKRGDSALFGLAGEINDGILRLLLQFIFLLITFATVDYKLMIVALIITIFNVVASYIVMKINLAARKEFVDEDDRLTGIIADNMVNFETVKYFAKEGFEQTRLRKALKPWVQKMWKYTYSFRYVDLVNGIFQAISFGSILFVAYLIFQEGNLTVAQFVLIITFATTFFPQITYFVYRLRSISKALIDLDKYLSILDEEIEVKDPEDNKKLELKTGEITFENVHFNYNDKKKVINGVDFKINSKETVAFVGESGAGKTTMIKLLFRFYDLNSGRILIDNQDISKVTKTSLRSEIGVVPQEPIMFNDTFKFNLTYPNLEISDKEVEKVLKNSRLDTVVENLKDGLDTIVGERGIKLSGGQKQRLAIGRAFIENSKIIVFDEATSQLDSESEEMIQGAFWKLAKDKTVIIIAHRLSTILKADRIVVFKDGQIVEVGTHKELIEKGDYYSRLWKIQKGGIID